jgi:hypothetical protein
MFSRNSSRLILGRSGELCDLVISDDSVSRQHAEICKNEAGFEVADRNSSNGTAVNGIFTGKPFQKIALKPGDTLTLAQVKLNFSRSLEMTTPSVPTSERANICCRAKSRGSAAGKDFVKTYATLLLLVSLFAGGLSLVCLTATQKYREKQTAQEQAAQIAIYGLQPPDQALITMAQSHLKTGVRVRTVGNESDALFQGRPYPSVDLFQGVWSKQCGTLRWCLEWSRLFSSGRFGSRLEVYRSRPCYFGQ